MTKLVFLLLLVVISMATSRSIHAHRHHHRMRDGNHSSQSQRTTISDIDGLPLEVIRNAKPSIVPVNNIMFFKRYDPCQDGYTRDIFGICREVWD